VIKPISVGFVYQGNEAFLFLQKAEKQLLIKARLGYKEILFVFFSFSFYICVVIRKGTVKDRSFLFFNTSC